MSPNNDETTSQSVARTAVDGRVFSLVLVKLEKKNMQSNLKIGKKQGNTTVNV